MPVIVLQFDDFKSNIYTRPDSCPYCGCQMLQRWGTGEKSVQDTNIEVGEYHRYRCNACQRTFRHYVQGVDKTHLTQRVRKIAGIAWALGLSARDVVAALAECGIELSYMTVWRNGNDIVTRFKDFFGPNQPGRYSIDKLFLNNQGRGIGTSIMVDLGNGKTIVLGRMDVVDYRKVLAWLEPILKNLDIRVSLIGTDVLFGMDHFQH
jgi:hypothetical protein